MGNIVSIVGRPNVGKSTLFNRLVEARRAIVDETSGVTRDRHYGQVQWNGKEFSVIDTGGYTVNSDDIFEEEIRKQVHLALEESDAVIFLVDVKSGITDLDQAVAKILRKQEDKKIFVVVNKVDNHSLRLDATEFYSLGIGDDIHCISSINGSGTGDLLDEVVNALDWEDEEAPEEDIPKYAIIGRPNVGKSSFINALVGEERNIVTPIAGTTRDTVYTRYNKFNHDFYLIDTAGIRKKGKVHENIEFYSVMRTVRAIEYADVCILMLDATRGLESQDVNVFHLVERNKKGIVILVNKWDLIEKDTSSAKKFEEELRKKIAPFNDVPVIFTSALTKQRIFKALEEAKHVYENRMRKIPTSKINEVMLKAIESYHPPSYRGNYIKIKYITQLPTYSPSFAFYANHPQQIKESYRRYLENQLRANFDFTGVPLRLFMRQK